MANWYGVGRSNTFKVKDVDEFLEDFEPVEIEFNINRETNEITLFTSNENGSFPSDYYDDESGDHVEFDTPSMIQKHLTDDTCCVLIEVGNEKMRYLTGWACAITSKEMEFTNLNEIYEIAEQLTGNSGTVTRAEY